MKTQSLADALGIQHPREKPVVDDNAPAKMSAEEFCKTLLNSSEFRVYILNGLVFNNLPPQILVRIMDQGWGKPVARIEVKDTTHVDDMLPQQLEHRAMALAKIARHTAKERKKPTDEGSVH